MPKKKNRQKKRKRSVVGQESLLLRERRHLSSKRDEKLRWEKGGGREKTAASEGTCRRKHGRTQKNILHRLEKKPKSGKKKFAVPLGAGKNLLRGSRDGGTGERDLSRIKPTAAGKTCGLCKKKEAWLPPKKNAHQEVVARGKRSEWPATNGRGRCYNPAEKRSRDGFI